MLDQSFSAENFRRIFDYENRKGNYLEGRFFPDVEDVTKQIHDLVGKIKVLKNKRLVMKPADYLKAKKKLYDDRTVLEREKEDLLTAHLEEISERVSTGSHQVTLKTVAVPGAKATYTISPDPQDFFVVKQLQWNFRRLYKVKQSNRFEILCQIKSLLKDEFPKYILRTDISSFYETIPANELLKYIESEALLSQTSKRYIRQIVSAYNTISSAKIGIPRGVGISAYLAELYARSLDRKLRGRENVVYYSRYVDDILIVMASSSDLVEKDEVLEVENIAISRKLKLNAAKTKFLTIPNTKKDSFEYLGYQITPMKNHVDFSFSSKKVTKYMSRIDMAFSRYHKQAKKNEKQARKLFVRRMRFLSGNTRLFNNKRDVLVGVYFSNRILNNTESLKHLDKHLKSEIGKLNSPAVVAQLSRLSFVDGFEQRKFSRFTPKELSEIVRPWKYGT